MEDGIITIQVFNINECLFNFVVVAYKWLCRLEGIFPALEASHALAFLDKLCPTLADGEKVVVNLSGRGDKDVTIVFNHTTKDE